MQSMIDKLNEGLPKGAVSKRKQGANFEVSYIEGWFAIEQANKIFGHLGWDFEVVSMNFYEGVGNKHEVISVVRVSVRTDGGKITKEDVGFGSASSKQGRELACKESVTDAMKRAFRGFGNAFGNSLYDKANTLHKGGDDTHAVLSTSKSGTVLDKFKQKLEGVSNADEYQRLMKEVASEIKTCGEEEKKQARELAKNKLKEIA